MSDMQKVCSKDYLEARYQICSIAKRLKAEAATNVEVAAAEEGNVEGVGAKEGNAAVGLENAVEINISQHLTQPLPISQHQVLEENVAPNNQPKRQIPKRNKLPIIRTNVVVVSSSQPAPPSTLSRETMQGAEKEPFKFMPTPRFKPPKKKKLIYLNVLLMVYRLC
ncbi:hypothetical protein PIB30_059674 [Stylosanthes scabra]|uniref:Uncharacterized protein n=1 Tax=Stylosanthes scabra TaxID=79078 RepID=A0ABU6YIY6_9FABA|nr:hypothetical protein [Stylosanthes scabra]